MPLWQELPLLLVVAFCLAVLIRTFLLQAFFIPSGSMENTLLIGDRVLVNKVVYDVRDPVRGEVVVFRGTDSWAPGARRRRRAGFAAKLGRTVGDLVGVSRPGEKDFIKRVIGVPGDKVGCCDDRAGSWSTACRSTSRTCSEDSPLDLPPNPQRVPVPAVRRGGRAGRADFVMGDHRLVSQDARCQGPVPIDNVIGRAFVIVWPLERWTSLPVPETFDAAVPQPRRPASGRRPRCDPRPGRAVWSWSSRSRRRSPFSRVPGGRRRARRRRLLP